MNNRKPTYIQFNKAGFSNKKCYLSVTKGCSNNISREHCISESLLNSLSKDKKTIDLCGLSWLPKKELRAIGKSRLVSKVLCAKHNSELSGLDLGIYEFADAIENINQIINKKNQSPLSYILNGEILERWILKTMVGLIESKQITQKNGKPYLYKSNCIKLICLPRHRWPVGWGL